jgi:hypothetical protein
MRIAAVLAVLLGLTCLPAVAESAIANHTVTIAAPARLDFTLATVKLSGPASGVRASVIGPTKHEYVAAAEVVKPPPAAIPPPPLAQAARSYPGPIFIVVVNRQQRDTPVAGSSAVSVRIHTRVPESVPQFSEHVDVLADGAPDQNCSWLAPNSALGHPYIYGMALKPLAGTVSEPSAETVGPGGVDEVVAHALAQACGDSIETTFERWVRQEPGPAHP